MNVKSFIIVGLGIATLGLSLPAHADTATVITTDQSAIITGDNNTTIQSSSTSVRNRHRGSDDGSSTGTVVNHRQTSDVAGSGNYTVQEANTTVDNDKDTRRNRRRY